MSDVATTGSESRYDEDTLVPDEDGPSAVVREELRKGPDLGADGFSPRTAFFCAGLSSAMYSRPAVVQELFEDIGLKKFKWFSRDVDAPFSPFGVLADTHGVVASTPEYIIAVFRGTQEPEDWATNLKALPKAFNPWGTAHAGFMEGVDTVWGEGTGDGMLAHIQSLHDEKSRPILLAGHSLGAALATIAGARLVAMDIPVFAIYTIGSPRVFDKAAAAAFNAHENFGKKMVDKTFRAVNCNDCVTVVPPDPPTAHVGTLIQINRRGELKVDELWDALHQHVEAVFVRGEFADFVLNHDSTRYCAAFQRAMQEAEGIAETLAALTMEDPEDEAEHKEKKL